MKVRIQKLGEGLALVIPPDVTSQSGFAENAEVEVTLENGALVARPVAAFRSRYTLAEALEGITDDNIHPETDTGPAVGNEIW